VVKNAFGISLHGHQRITAAIGNRANHRSGIVRQKINLEQENSRILFAAPDLFQRPSPLAQNQLPANIILYFPSL
jgi:hypothetical protein